MATRPYPIPIALFLFVLFCKTRSIATRCIVLRSRSFNTAPTAQGQGLEGRLRGVSARVGPYETSETKSAKATSPQTIAPFSAPKSGDVKRGWGLVVPQIQSLLTQTRRAGVGGDYAEGIACRPRPRALSSCLLAASPPGVPASPSETLHPSPQVLVDDVKGVVEPAIEGALIGVMNVGDGPTTAAKSIAAGLRNSLFLLQPTVEDLIRRALGVEGASEEATSTRGRVLLAEASTSTAINLNALTNMATDLNATVSKELQRLLVTVPIGDVVGVLEGALQEACVQQRRDAKGASPVPLGCLAAAQGAGGGGWCTQKAVCGHRRSHVI